MTTRSAIKKCDDIELLRILALSQRRQLFVISEVLVDESKMNISAEVAIRKIRDYLNMNDCEVDFDWIKKQIENKNMNKETVTISKKEYELLKKHQDEYKELLDVLEDVEYDAEDRSIKLISSNKDTIDLSDIGFIAAITKIRCSFERRLVILKNEYEERKLNEKL